MPSKIINSVTVASSRGSDWVSYVGSIVRKEKNEEQESSDYIDDKRK